MTMPNSGATAGTTTPIAIITPSSLATAMPTARSATTARPSTIPAPAPMPWTKRQPIIQPTFGETAIAAPASTKSATPTSSAPLRPVRSLSGPKTS